LEKHLVTFACFELDQSADHVRSSRGPDRLQGQPYRILNHLITNRGQWIKKGDLLKAVETSIDGGTLRSHVSNIRAWLRENGGGETVFIPEARSGAYAFTYDGKIEDVIVSRTDPQTTPPQLPDVERAYLLGTSNAARRPRLLLALTSKALLSIGRYARLCISFIRHPQQFLEERVDSSDESSTTAIRFFLLCVAVSLCSLVYQHLTVLSVLPYLISVVGPPAVTYLLWSWALSRTPGVLAATCYVAGVSVLIASFVRLATILVFVASEPECRTWAQGCDLTSWFLQAMHGHPVFSIGSYTATRIDLSTGPAYVPILTVWGVGIVLGVGWWVLGTRAVARNFAPARPGRAFLLFGAIFASNLGLAVGSLVALTPGHAVDYATGCMNPPLTASLNIWPLTYDNALPCHDLPLVDVADPKSADERSRRYSLNQEEHDRGIVTDTGHGLSAILYFNNGAAENVPLSQSTAKHTHIRFILEKRSDNQFLISAHLWAENAPLVTSADIARGGDILVSISRPGALTFIPGSALLCVQSAHAQLLGVATDTNCPGSPSIKVKVSDEIFGKNGLDIGDLPASWRFSGTANVGIRVQPAE
jgi:DNA-binding winged helix-turn-helix (wHTH) protein